VAMDVRMKVMVPVHTFGEPAGVKVQGGAIEVVTREVEIECLPADIPTEFKVDGSGLMLNQQMRAGRLSTATTTLKLFTEPERATRGGIRVERPEGKALVGRGKIAGEEVILAKTQTYMNLSGISVRDLLDKYELGTDDLLLMWDEAQLPLGTIRIHQDGSAGSH